MIRDLLKNKSTKEKANIKGQEIAKIDFRGIYNNSQYAVKIDIIEINAIEGGVEVFAKGWKDSKQLGFGKDGSVEVERFLIYNPPISVEDSNGDIVLEWEQGDVDERVIMRRILREDPAEAIRQVISHNVTLVGKENTQIIKGKVGNTTSTFFPDAHVESTSVDGTAQRGSVSENWSVIRAGAGNGSTDSIANFDESGLRVSTSSAGAWRTMKRSFTLFDTSALPDGDTIDSATLSLYSTTVTNEITPTTGVIAYSIIATTPASNTAIASSDYGNTGTTRQADTDIAIGDITTSAYNDWTLNATGEGNISKTGISKFGFAISRDIDDDEPTGSHSLGAKAVAEFSTADETTGGTAQHPKLVVVHSSALQPRSPSGGIMFSGGIAII